MTRDLTKFRLINQMLKGCHRSVCVNPLCKKNPAYRARTQQQALSDSIKLVGEYENKSFEALKAIVCDSQAQQAQARAIQKCHVEAVPDAEGKQVIYEKEFLQNLAKSPYE